MRTAKATRSPPILPRPGRFAARTEQAGVQVITPKYSTAVVPACEAPPTPTHSTPAGPPAGNPPPTPRHSTPAGHHRRNNPPPARPGTPAATSIVSNQLLAGK